MTKSELARRVAEQVPYLAKEDVTMVVDVIFHRMTQSLVRGERIEIRGLGSFEVVHRKAREGMNPKTGERVSIPARRAILFRAGKALRERINPSSEEGED